MDGNAAIREPGTRARKTLTRDELAGQLHEATGLSRRDSGKIVGDILRHISTAPAAGDNVSIVGFGSFLLRDKPARRSRGLNGGGDVVIPARRVVTFRPGARMRERIARG